MSETARKIHFSAEVSTCYELSTVCETEIWLKADTFTFWRVSPKCFTPA